MNADGLRWKKVFHDLSFANTLNLNLGVWVQVQLLPELNLEVQVWVHQKRAEPALN